MRADISAAVKKIFEKLKKLGLAVDDWIEFLDKIEYFEWKKDTTDPEDKPKQGAARTYQKRYRRYRTIFVAEIVKVILAGKFASCGPLPLFDLRQVGLRDWTAAIRVSGRGRPPARSCRGPCRAGYLPPL